MAKDQRLYMTFPNDFWMHPKIAPLSTEAKWSFVEMNGYSRMQDLDGRIPAVMVHRMWASEVVTELIQSHPERPVILLDGDVYVIRDYAEHQQTTADREGLSSKRSDAGRAGRAKQLAGKDQASAGQVPGQSWAETETETETTKEVLPSNAQIDPLFESAYSHWPKKVEKKEALERFRKAAKKHSLAKLAADVARFGDAYKASTEKQFTPSLGRWLMQERWTDELPTQSGQLKPTKDERALSLIEQGRAMDEAQARKELSA